MVATKKVLLYLPEEVLEIVDEHCALMSMNRSEYLRELLRNEFSAEIKERATVKRNIREIAKKND